MIPGNLFFVRPTTPLRRTSLLYLFVAATFAQAAPPHDASLPASASTATGSVAARPAATATARGTASAGAGATGCLSTGDGFLKAHLAGAINLDVDWPNGGTTCEGESRPGDAGVRLSFRRNPAAHPNLLFVFGLSGVREGEPLRGAGANLTIIVQGKSAIYSTRSDTRCTVDSLRQQPLTAPHDFRVEVRGFCTQPAHAVRGDGGVLVSRFDFAGRVHYILPGDDP